MARYDSLEEMYPTGPTPGGSSNEEYDLEKVYPTEMTSAPNSAPKPAATASQASQTPASGNASSSGSGSGQDADDLEMRYPTGPMPGNSGRGISGDVNDNSASPTHNGSDDEEYHDTAEDYDKDEADLIELQYPTGPPPKTDDDSDDDRFDGETGDELVEYLERKIQGYRPLSEKDLEKLRRKQKAEGIISGISDAVRSVANLIATHHYAPNMYNSNSSMSAKAQARFDKAKADRDAEDDQHFNYVMALRRLRDADAATEYQHKRDALQDRIRLSQEARAQLKADRDAALANLRMELMQGQIDEKEAAAEAKKIEAEYADQIWKARVDEIKSRTNKNDRWQPSTGRGGGGGGGAKGYPVYDADGNVVGHVPKKVEAVTRSAKNEYEYPEEVTTTTRNSRGEVTGSVKKYNVKPHGATTKNVLSKWQKTK